MKKLSIITALIISASLVACTGTDEVNGRSIRTVNKSVMYIKRHLPVDQQVEFEVAFWTIRDAVKDEKELADKLDGKKAPEVVAMAKEIFQQRKNSGVKEYQQFATWEQMIAKYGQERIEQTKHKKADPRDEKNNLMYKL